MSFSVDEFKGAISKGIAVPNMFRVYLPALPGVVTTRQLNLLCKDVQLPGRQILTNERVIGMKQVKQAYGYASEDVSLTFYVTNDYGLRQYFEKWQDLIITDKELNYPDEYGFEVRIEQLQKGAALDLPVDINFNLFGLNIDIDFDLFKDAKSIYTCVLDKAFPTTMNAIQLNNEQGGLVELNVQLSYKDWRSV
jgi:hypothetical protein|tara:strand:+ start:17539 stop:18120 length:582 start_codon:yes stop_codon:yes gene_type:complete